MPVSKRRSQVRRVGPDFYRDDEPEPGPADEASSRDLIDTEDPAFRSIMLACMQLSEEYGFDLADPDVVRGAIYAGRERHRRVIRRLHEAQDNATSRTEIVYYMRIGNRVKIGFTTDLAQRMAVIGPEEVMATEPGGREVEARRHAQFAELRSHREWFRLVSPLVEHICELQGA